MDTQISDGLAQSLLENTSSVILGIDGETQLLYANPKARKVLGYSDEDFRTQRLYNWIPDHKKYAFAQALDQTLETAGNASIELLLRCKNGDPCWLSGVLSRWQYNDIRGVVFYGIEKMPAPDDESLTALLNNLPGYAYRCLNDRQWTSLVVSKGVSEVTGYAPEDIIHNRTIPFNEVLHPDDRLRDWEETQSALREYRRYESTYRIITKAGEERWVLDNGRGIYNINDELLALEGLIVDITEQKKMEQALQESEARNAALLNAVPDLMFRFDREGTYLDFKINDKLYVPRYEIVGKTVHDLLPKDIAEKNLKAIAHTLKTGEVSIFEYQLTPPLHRLKDYEARIVAVGENEVFCIVRDITERKSVERDLRQSEERLNVLISSVPVMFYALDHELKFTLARGAVLNNLNLTPDYYEGKSVYELYQDYPVVFEAVEAALRGESRTFTMETKHHTFLATSTPIFNEEGKVIGVTGVSTDISQQQQAEDALREAVNQLMMQYEGSRALITATTLTELLKAFAGRAVENEKCHVSLFYVRNDDADQPKILELAAFLTPSTPMLEIPPEKLTFNIGDVPLLHDLQVVSYKMLIVPDVDAEKKNLTEKNRKMLQAYGTKAFAVIPLKLHDQWIGIVSMAWNTPHEITPEAQQYYETLAPQFAAALENLILFEQIETALTENRRLLATTRYSEDLLRRFVEHMPLAIAMVDTEMRYLVANRHWLTSYRLGDIELIGRSHYEIFPEIGEKWKAIHQRCLNGEVILAEADPFERPDGAIDWVRWEVRPWHTFEGTIGGIVMYTEVINERIRQQTERDKMIVELQAANEKVMEASRLKSEFLATMSHELRTPLNTIIGFSGIMLEGIAGEFDDTTRYMINATYESGENLLALINDILDISKIEAGWFELIWRSLDTRAMVTRWESHFRDIAAQKRIAFEVELDPALPPQLIGDDERLTQIATKLLSNAFKFTDEGKVTLAVRWKKETFVIEVGDTGIGIAKEAMGFIFEAFRQVDSSLRRPYGGTGLGLSIVHRLCEAMGGEVMVKSKPGKGSTFTVKLPLKKGDSAR